MKSLYLITIIASIVAFAFVPLSLLYAKYSMRDKQWFSFIAYIGFALLFLCLGGVLIYAVRIG